MSVFCGCHYSFYVSLMFIENSNESYRTAGLIWKASLLFMLNRCLVNNVYDLAIFIPEIAMYDDNTFSVTFLNSMDVFTNFSYYESILYIHIHRWNFRGQHGYRLVNIPSKHVHILQYNFCAKHEFRLVNIPSKWYPISISK